MIEDCLWTAGIYKNVIREDLHYRLKGTSLPDAMPNEDQVPAKEVFDVLTVK